MGIRLLPWEYGVRNLFRRPIRSALTLAGLALVVLLVLVVVGFIHGLEASLAVSGEPGVVIVHSRGAAENVENSTVPGRTPALLTASVSGIQRRPGPGGTPVLAASPELYLGTRVAGEGRLASMGIVRGVTPAAALVHGRVQVTDGRWPGSGEALVGRLAATKLGLPAGALATGRTLTFEGRGWTVCGTFAATGSALESELWCPLEDLQQAMKRQDLSIVAVKLAPGADFAELDDFCKDQIALEIQATPEATYYESLRRHYHPVRLVCWFVVGLVAASGIFVGLNTMYGAVAGRVREMATLQALGFARPAIALSLVQEGTLLAVTASLAATAAALAVVNGAAVRFTMGAFTLRVDSAAVIAGCGAGLLLGVIGSLPPAVRAMRLPVVDGLKAV
jgi:putative ABC transport system permease protein